MNLKNNLVAVLWILLPLMTVLQQSSVGFSSSTTYSFVANASAPSISVSAQSHPGLILWALVCLVLYGALLQVKPASTSLKIVSLWKRYFAALIDFVFCMFVLGTLIALIPLGMEAARTGVFNWSFERNYHVSADIYFWPITLVMFGLILWYMGYPLTTGKRSVGNYVLGLQTTVDGKPAQVTWGKALKRVGWVLLGAMVFPYTLIKGRDEKGQTWYDRRSGISVLSDANPAKAGGKVIIGYLLGCSLILAAAYGIDHYVSQMPSTDHWRTFAYADYGFSVESPMALPVDKEAYESTDLAAHQLKKMDMEKDSDKIYMNVEVDQFDRDMAAGMISDWKKVFLNEQTAKFSDLKSDSQPVTVSQTAGLRMSATFTSSKGHAMRRDVLVLQRGPWFWCFNMIGYDTPDEAVTAKRFLDSVKLIQ